MTRLKLCQLLVEFVIIRIHYQDDLSSLIDLNPLYFNAGSDCATQSACHVSLLEWGRAAGQSESPVAAVRMFAVANPLCEPVIDRCQEIS